MRPLYKYQEVMPDKAGNQCGLWYRSLNVPPEMGNIKDPNCCF